MILSLVTFYSRPPGQLKIEPFFKRSAQRLRFQASVEGSQGKSVQRLATFSCIRFLDKELEWTTELSSV